MQLRLLFAVFLLLGLVPLQADSAPWWDNFPTILRTSDAAAAGPAHAVAALDGQAGDPSWGLYGQRLSMVDKKKEAFQNLGIREIAYFEGYGECANYIAQLKRAADGSWLKETGDPSVTQVFSTFWTWPTFDGTGEIRWIGPANYFDNQDFARPWTRMNLQYVAPPMRYPDGRIATGYNGSADDPRNSRVLDAGCSKDVLGQLACSYDENEAVNRPKPDKSGLTGPLTGLIEVHDQPAGLPDPGYTPEEWKRLKAAGYSGHISIGKDTACPSWIDAVRVSVRQAAEYGVAGAWVDNYSPWDNFNSRPVLKAFGDWSVATFRSYLRRHFTRKQLQAMGVADPAHFDVRAYLQTQCRAWGGDPQDLNSRTWSDPRWLDDPVWRAYLIHKRQSGTAALTQYYRAAKKAAAAAGEPDFLIFGNDIPGFSLGWPRGDLDMVSTELSWGWGLTTGPRGLGPPPGGSFVPVYKLAREHARGRFVTYWPYVPAEEMNKPNIARVLYYQGLANHALAMPNEEKGGAAGARNAGTPEVNAAFFEFVNKSAPTFGARTPIEEVGLYYSSSSQLMEMTPGGVRNHSLQPHSFSFYGWGTALTELHLPWRALPEWKLTATALRPLRMVIIPSANVFPARDAAVLEAWVRAGGLLVVAGSSGQRDGEAANFSPAATLRTLLEGAGAGRHPLGEGSVLNLADDPGLAFYLDDPAARSARLDAFQRAFSELSFTTSLDAPAVPTTVGLTLYHDTGRLFVDANNTDIDLGRDTITDAPPTRFSVVLPRDLRGKQLTARVLSPDGAPHVSIQPAGDKITVSLDSFSVYASVLIEAAK